MLVYEKGDPELRSELKVLFELRRKSCGCRFGVQEHDRQHTIRSKANSEEGNGLYFVRCPNCQREVVYS